MYLQQLTEILYFSALVLFNFFFLFAIVASIFIMVAIKKTTKKINEVVEKAGETIDSIKSSTLNFSHVATSIFESFAPFVFRKRQPKPKSTLSKIISFFE
jgi:hypothetical protein